MKESLAEIMVARSIEKLVSRQREQVARDGGARCVIRTVLLLLADRGLGRRGGRRSIVNRRLMRMHGVDGRRGHVGQGRRRRGRLMMIVMMMNAAPWVESISALEDARWWRGWYSSGSSTQNCGTGRAAARHGAAGHGYG